jgi:hypothetical protein
MAFELTVSLGDIAASVGFVVTAVGAVMAVKSNLTVLTTKVDLTDRQNEERFVRIDAQFNDVKVEMQKLSEVLIGLTRTEGRQNITDERVLAQGKRIDSIAETLRDILMGRKPATF